jgi:hypothetical protein
VQYWRDALFDDDLKQLAEKEVEELTPEQRLKIVQAFAGVEAFKQLEFAAMAVAEVEPGLPVEHALRTRQDVLDFYEEQAGGFETLVAPCSAPKVQDPGECYNRQAEMILREGYDLLIGSLKRHGGFDTEQLDRFERAYARAQRYFAVTEAVGTHAFEIRVNMPGEIVGHNGEKTDTDERGNVCTAVFQFSGEAFRDRTHELLVVSRVAGAGDDAHGKDDHGPGR